MSDPENRCRLVLEDGTVLDRFEEYRVRGDMRQMGGSFVLTMRPVDDYDLVEYLNTNPAVQVEVDGTPVITGRVGQCDLGESRQEGSWANIVGEDLLGVAAKSCLPRGFSVAGLSVVDSIAAALAAYELPIIGTNDANRDLVGRRRVRVPDGTPVQTWQRLTNADGSARWNPDGTPAFGYAANGSTSYRYRLDPRTERYVRETKEITITDRDERALTPTPGERIGSWIARVCEEHRLMVWLTADGNVFVGRPRYDQINIPSIAVGGLPGEGMVERIEWSRRPIDQAARIEVCGRVGRTGSANVVGFSSDDELLDAAWLTYQLEVEEGLRDVEKAMDKASRILHDQQVDCWQVRATLSGHGIGSSLPAPDLMMHTTIPRYRMDRDLYVVARDFSKSKQRGTVVDLTLVRPNLLLA